jgi:hypothetical protein
MTEFVQAEVSDRADLYAVPGGPAVLDPWNSTFDEARVFDQSMRLFAEHHDLSEVWLIAHESCAWYRVRHLHLDPATIRRRQMEDLRRGREVILERYRSYDVRLIYASHDGDGVVFRDCTHERQEAEA